MTALHIAALIYLYSRFSDPRQAKGQSYERQMAYAEEWAKKRGLQIDTSLSMNDAGLSGFTGKNVKSGALGVFLAAVKAGLIPRGSYLLVEQLDRLSRRAARIASRQFDDLIDAGITIVTTKNGREYNAEYLEANPFGMFEPMLEMILAHEESKNKSKRVVAQIRSKCEKWMDGTERKPIRNGGDPSWLKLVDGKWELIPEHVTGIRAAISLYKQGIGPKAIVQKLQEDGLTMTGNKLRFMQIHRVLKQRQLIGEKTLNVDGTTFNLIDYYPPILSDNEFAELDVLLKSGVRQIGKKVLVGVLTGIKVATCGYCGSAMFGTNHLNKGKDTNRIFSDGYRRITCSGINNDLCPVKGGASVAPFERALMNFCSDMINLRSLYGADRSAIPLAKLNKDKAKLTKVSASLDRCAEAMIASDGDVARFVKLARDLEAEQKELIVAIENDERELFASSRTAINGTHKSWKALSKGVVDQDDEARTQARKLVSDTFEKILFWVKGVRPRKTGSNILAMTLIAKGGEPRLLQVTDKGEYLLGDAATHKDALKYQAKKAATAS
jgi:DNA invertase Pin-like site-specific DNA recombinase